MNSLVFYILIVFFWIGAIFRGLFDDFAFLGMHVFLYLGLLVALLVHKRVEFSSFHLWVFLFVLFYWVSVLYAVDVEQALLEASRVSGLIPLSLLMTMLQLGQKVKLYKSWVWIGVVLTVLGIMNQMYRDGRLESTLAYANALAIFLLVGLLISIGIYVKEKRLIYLVLVTVNATGLLLTFSRSVWVLWLLSVVVLVLVTPELRKKAAVLKLGLAHLTGLVFAIVTKQETLFFWKRVKSIQPGTSEFEIRLVYWKDSLQMILDYWWGGSGGGGWSVLQHLYQSQTYYVKFIHNHYAQVTLDIGVWGLLIFLSILFVFYRNTFVYSVSTQTSSPYGIKALWIMVTVMLLHAGFDFDLSFPLIFGMLICLMASINPKGIAIHFSSKIKLIPIAFVLVAIMFFFSWMTVGYMQKKLGMMDIQKEQYESAQQRFDKAEVMVPWSSSIRYESAKGYVLMGNQSRDSIYYDAAARKLKAARAMVPEQTLYMDLLEELNKR
jgi:hypothetical protein